VDLNTVDGVPAKTTPCAFTAIATTQRFVKPSDVLVHVAPLSLERNTPSKEVPA
jgi:hypothetical protein